MNQNQLERYSFLWSEARLVIAAVALFIGGVPPLQAYGHLPSGLTSSLLTIAWLISGLASGYLFYRWYTGNKMLFGRKENLDTAAFFVSVISGINLGVVGLLRTNIGMSISSNQMIFNLVGLLYIVSAGYLYKRWLSHGQRIF